MSEAIQTYPCKRFNVLDRWDKRFFELCGLLATWSEDRRTNVGAVIVGDGKEIVATGYNGFPRGVDQTLDARHSDVQKYMWTEHAERNAIYNAARHGGVLNNTMIYSSFFPCADCARAIIQAGVGEVKSLHSDYLFDKHGDSLKISAQMLNEAGVAITLFNRPDFLDASHKLFM